MIGWIALTITLAIFASIALRIDDWGRDWTENTASLVPDAQREGLRPVELESDLAETQSRLERWVESDSRWSIVSVSPNDELPVRLKLTRTTPIMRFVDDIEVTIDGRPGSGGVIIHATSKSRVGKGDLGQNPRNLIELTNGLRDQ